jgi:hypothetical protein
MKIVLQISENGRTATRRVTADGLLYVDDVVRAYFSAAKELNLQPVANDPAPGTVDEEPDGRTDGEMSGDEN